MLPGNANAIFVYYGGGPHVPLACIAWSHHQPCIPAFSSPSKHRQMPRFGAGIVIAPQQPFTRCAFRIIIITIIITIIIILVVAVVS